METKQKTVPPLTLLSASRKLKKEEIPAFAGEAVQSLYAKLGELGVKPAGDLVFVYNCTRGADGIDCCIGIPIAESKFDAAPFQVVQLNDFRCESAIYQGSMRGIGPAWEKMYGSLKARGAQCGTESREVYIHWVDFDSAENRTELQVGVE
jgi:effector-binding domain-containing protein